MQQHDKQHLKKLLESLPRRRRLLESLLTKRRSEAARIAAEIAAKEAAILARKKEVPEEKNALS